MTKFLRLKNMAEALGVPYDWLYYHRPDHGMQARCLYDEADLERLRTWLQEFKETEKRKQSLVRKKR